MPSFPGKCGSQDTRHSELSFKRYTTRKILGIGRGVVVKSRMSGNNFVVFPLLGISGSDFSTLDIVSVLASLLFMVEA